ncbi:ABC transporter ATP-binding protein [Acrocarpospora macrocephala]|uniref:ABC transporter n=1 Tax=Acrocarpospora macrocephala TaxID=150177 RepID=A0A5M3XA42_9ACTN|nr:ABC transporter ATP-binding protein [Acrocarpospora macrocephala]GES16371.1 ABC transporter [Acrocarpospora macrocephala]
MLGQLLAPVRGRLWAAAGLQVVAAVAGLVPYVMVAELARELLGAGDAGRAWAIVGVAVAAVVVRIVAMGVAVTVTHLADAGLQLRLRRGIVAKLGTVPLGWFTARSSGAVKTAVQDDVNSLHHLVGHAVLDLVSAVVVPVLSLAYLFWVDWRMALATVGTLPIYLLAYAVMMRGYQAKLGEVAEATARINSTAVEFVHGIAVVKTFGQARRSYQRFARAADDFSARFRSWVEPMTRIEAAAQGAIMPVTVLLVVLVTGTALVSAGSLAAVDILPFALLGLGLGQPIVTLGFGIGALQEAREAAGRVTGVLAAPELPQPRVKAAPDGHLVEFDQVGFSYDGANEVLSDINLTMSPGTVTALVGHSGSGKSTLARLLARYWDPTSGVVRIGGADVRDIPPGELVATVFQDVRLLRMTVRDNIALGRPHATDEEIYAAAKAAQIHDRILALPGGYDAEADLSGGEAQRVSIARALLADTPVLVLDEATAFADPESEAAIQDALSTLAAGRTVLVIAHRLPTIVGVDQIVVLDRGRIAQRGTHPQLLAENGVYRTLWERSR